MHISNTQGKDLDIKATFRKSQQKYVFFKMFSLHRNHGVPSEGINFAPFGAYLNYPKDHAKRRVPCFGPQNHRQF